MSTIAPGPDRRDQVTKKLLMVFTIEQLEQFAEQAVLIRDRAILRQCNQTLDFEVNNKGLIRHFHGSDNVTAAKPTTTTYQPE